MAAGKTWFVYLIECSDGCLYTGIAVDPVARFEVHRQGRGARYMRLHQPQRLLAVEAHSDRAAASRAEYRIKQLSPAAKRNYVIGMIAAAALATNPALAKP